MSQPSKGRILKNVGDIVDNFYGTFGLKLHVRFSFHDLAEIDKYLGTQEIWQNAEDVLIGIAKERGADYFEALVEVTYGTKLDCIATDSFDREHQVATIQLDMNLLERFDLICINEKGKKECIGMIHHCSNGIYWTLYCSDAWAYLWHAPHTHLYQYKCVCGQSHRSISNMPINVSDILNTVCVRVEVDNPDESLGKKICNTKWQKLPYVLVVGDKETEEVAVSEESRDSGRQVAMKV